MTAKLWTAAIVASRFSEATLTLRRLPSVRVLGYHNCWPAVKLSPDEVAQQDKRPMKLVPTAGAITRLDEALTWLSWIEVDERQLIWRRAARVPWKRICGQMGCDRSTAWRKWSLALEKITMALNVSRHGKE